MRSAKGRLIAVLVAMVVSACLGFGLVIFFFGDNGGTKSPEPTSEAHSPTATIEQPTPTVSKPTKIPRPLATETPVSTLGQEELTATPVEPTNPATSEPTVAPKTPTTQPTKEPTKPIIDTSDPASLVNATKEFLEERETQSLLPGQTYRLVRIDGPAQNWIISTVAFHDESWPEGTGAGGMIAISHIEDNYLISYLPGDEGFSSLVANLPEGLLPESLREWYGQEALSSLPSYPLTSLGLVGQPVFYLPYQDGEKYKINVLPGVGHHTGNHQYAIDLGLPEGTPITASIGGKVLSFKDDSNSGGCSTSYDKDANYILIEITPGDAILYLHLQVGSVTANKIQVGQTVEVGQIIGASGSTGFTCNSTGRGAHLHIERGKPYNNQKRIEISTPLTFVEFKPEDPRYNIEYISQNQSPEERRAEEEKKRQQDQLTEEEKARLPVRTALENFYKAYRCSRLVDCSETDVTEELKWVTNKAHNKLFGFIICLFCGPKDDKLESVGEAEYVSFPVPTSETTSLTVRVKAIAKVTIGDEVTFHYTVTDISLVKEDGQWKVDAWNITCGFVTDKEVGKGEEVKVLYMENLEGCEWQPPSGGSW